MADKSEKKPAHNLRAIWKKGDCALNGWLALPCAFSAEIMARQGWDSLTIDAQHGLINYDSAVAMLSAASPFLPVLVRAPWLEEGAIMKLLDAGADGIICPMVNNRADAERLAAATRYPPLGRRSFGPIRARFVFGDDYAAVANTEIVVLAMLETAEAVANADAILSVPGIDGAYCGPSDLAYSLGCKIESPFAAPVSAALDEILAAARRCQKIAAAHAFSPKDVAVLRQKNFAMITAASDARILESSARDSVKNFRGGG